MPFIKTVFQHFISFTPRMNTTLQEKKCFPLNRIEEFAKAKAQWKEINSIYSDWILCGYNILVEFHTAHSYLFMRDGVSCSRTIEWKRRSVQEKNYQTGNKRLCYKFYTRSGNIFFLLSIISHSIHSLHDEKRWTCNRNLKHFSYLTKEWFFFDFDYYFKSSEFITESFVCEWFYQIDRYRRLHENWAGVKSNGMSGTAETTAIAATIEHQWRYKRTKLKDEHTQQHDK